jgi:uridine kinase
MKVVAIGGCSGSGKSYLARALAARLAGCSTIELDSYYWPLPELTVEQRAARNYDHPDALEWALLETHLQTLARGEAVQVPVYLFNEHTRAVEARVVRPREAVVVEGILALHWPAIRDLAHVKVFVETTARECFERRLTRDVAERGRSKESVLEQHRATVWPMAAEFVLPSAAHADIVVSGERSVAEAVEQIIRML